MPVSLVTRLFLAWFAIVVLDGVLSATISPSSTAGFLTVAGSIGILGGTWLHQETDFISKPDTRPRSRGLP